MNWHPHDGGNGPHPDTIVIPRIRVLSRRHVEERGIPGPASRWRWPWGRTREAGDILEYLA